MNCDDYLSMLSTVSVQELSQGRAREHADTCRDCDRVTRVVAEREYNMVTAYDNLYASVPATQTATRSVVMARREKLTSYVEWGVGLAIAATVLAMVGFRMFPSEVQIPRIEATFRLQCLSPEQAAALLRPFLSSQASMVIRPSAPIGVITVDAPSADIEIARNILRTTDSPSQSQCAVQVTLPATVPSTMPDPASLQSPVPAPVAAPTPPAPDVRRFF